MGHKFTLNEVTGGANALIPLFKAHASKERISIDACVAVASGLAQMLARTTLASVIEPQLEDLKDTYVIVNGDYESSTDPNEWESGADDVTEAVLCEYDRSLSASWLGAQCVDVHMQDDDFVSRLTSGFVQDAMAELIHDSSDKPDDGDTRVLSAAKILSACGVVKSDLVPFCYREPVDVIGPEDSEELQAAHAAANQEETVMSNMDAVYNTVAESVMMGITDGDEIAALFDNASDSDDGIALSGVMLLGLDQSAIPLMRAYLEDNGNDAKKAGDEFAFMVSMAPYATADETHGSPELDDDAEFLRSQGLDPGPTMQTVGPAPPPPAAVQTSVALPPITAAPPATVRPARVPVSGDLPARAIGLLRQFIKQKDEDVAAIIGVSRQTFLNYEKGKARLVLSEAQRNALVVLVDQATEGLREARELIENA